MCILSCIISEALCAVILVVEYEITGQLFIYGELLAAWIKGRGYVRGHLSRLLPDQVTSGTRLVLVNMVRFGLLP